MPFCLSAEKATFPWLNGKHLPWIEKLPALKTAMDSFTEDSATDDHVGTDDEPWRCGAHGKALRVTSDILPTWTDVYTPDKWSDTYVDVRARSARIFNHFTLSCFNFTLSCFNFTGEFHAHRSLNTAR